MANLIDIVSKIHPAASGIGIILSDKIWVIFDREIDEDSFSNGNLFVAGPDFDTWSGPDLQIFQDRPSIGTESEILQSPGYHGMVQGTFAFERLDLSSDSIVTTLDTVGSGLLYRTKAVFTPREKLAIDTEYTVYLSGDEDTTDDISSGVLSRTVFDSVAASGIVSVGEVGFVGSYFGAAPTDTYNLSIAISGDISTAKFSFYRTSDPFTVFGPFKTRLSGVPLSDGVVATFTDGSYVAGDTWTVAVKSPETFSGNINWPFKTGSGSIEVIPEDISTSVIATTIAGTSVTTVSPTFNIVSTRPTDFATNQTIPANDYPIYINFDSPIDSSSVIAGVTIDAFSEPVTGIGSDGVYPSGGAKGALDYSLLVSGNQLQVILGSGQLTGNNLVTISLDAALSNTSGVYLGETYDFSFSTAYTPLYCSARRLRLAAGQYMTGIPDDTLYLAIHLASMEADERTWNKTDMEPDFYNFVRSEWTCCRATQTILSNTIGGPGRPKRKQLGDLAVEYDTTKETVSIPLNRVQVCLDKWEKELQAGGRAIQKPLYSVKGEWDVDRPQIGRQWLHTRDWLNTQTPAANMRVRPLISRRVKNVYGHRGWWER